MGNLVDNDTEFLFSIFQNISAKNNGNFNFQRVRRKKYYPAELQYLSQKVESTENPLEIEKLVEQFNSFINNRKNDLLNMEKLSRIREKINLRQFFILVDQFDNLIHSKEGKIIFLAGPLGGELLKLNEELSEIEKERYFQLVEFDPHNVGRSIISVELNLEFTDYILSTDDDAKIKTNLFPLKLPDYIIRVVRAVEFFQNDYEKLSMINDFSPIIDSSLTAVNASIMGNSRYFIDLPDVVKQKFEQYNLQNDDYYPNLFGIQKLMDQSNSRNTLEIQGYSFYEQNKLYSFILKSLNEDLSCFALVEGSFDKLIKFLEIIKENHELQYQIQNIQKQNSTNIVNIAHTSFNPILEEVIGSNKILTYLENIDPDLMLISLPIGFVRVCTNVEPDDPSYFSTSFSKPQLPPVYSRIATDLMNSLEVIASGTLETLSFNTGNVSVYLKSGQHQFKIELRKVDKNVKDLVVYLYGSFTDLRKTMIEENLFWKDEMINYIDNLQDDEIYEELLTFLPINQQMSRLEFDDNFNQYPLTTYTKSCLKEFLVPVLLKRVLKEVEDFEREKYNEDNENQGLEPQSIKNISSNIKQFERNYDKELQKLEEEINAFNPGMFSFLTNMLRREESINGDDGAKLYNMISEIFSNMIIALIDFGLTPEQWKFADNLQLWNSYQAQIKYLTHSIVLNLRKFLGEGYEGDDIDRLASHKFTQRLNYTSYQSGSSKGKYHNLRKIHLSFMPLLRKYDEQLEASENLDQLLLIIEELEEKKKAKIQSQLPSLPGLMK